MRIVSGAYRGRALVAPKGQSTRPTADRTRQALFNVLEHAPWSPGLFGRRVLDLFAGSGALGLEAMSRGATGCVFIDNDMNARAVIADNAQSLGVTSKVAIERFDATRLGPPREHAGFGLAFLDPPYGQGLCEPALLGLADHDWLEPGAVVIIERGLTEAPLRVAGFDVLDIRDWGAARVYFLRLASPPAE